MDELNLNKLDNVELRALIRGANDVMEQRAREARSFYVWAKTDDPKWLERNGTADVAISPTGMTEREANFLAERLTMLGVKGVEVRQP